MKNNKKFSLDGEVSAEARLLKSLLTLIVILAVAFRYAWSERLSFLSGGGILHLVNSVAFSGVFIYGLGRVVFPKPHTYFKFTLKVIKGALASNPLEHAIAFYTHTTILTILIVPPWSLDLSAYQYCYLAILLLLSIWAGHSAYLQIDQSFNSFKRDLGAAHYSKTLARMKQITWASFNPDHLHGVMYRFFFVPFFAILSIAWSPFFVIFIPYFILGMISSQNRSTRPPFVLFLTGNLSVSRKAIQKIKLLCEEEVVRHLIMENGGAPPANVGNDSIRISDFPQEREELAPLQWQSVVLDLMLISRIIVIDCRFFSEGVKEELEMSLLNGHGEKTYLIGSQREINAMAAESAQVRLDVSDVRRGSCEHVMSLLAKKIREFKPVDSFVDETARLMMRRLWSKKR